MVERATSDTPDAWPVLLKRGAQNLADIQRHRCYLLHARLLHNAFWKQAAVQQQKALEQRARLADQDACEAVLAAKERHIPTAAARVSHSELAAQATTEVEKAKEPLAGWP